MNLFTAPNWDLDEASEKMSKNIFVGNIIPRDEKKKNRKKMSKNNESFSPGKTHCTKNIQSIGQSENGFGQMLKKAKKGLTALTQKPKNLSVSDSVERETTAPSTDNQISRSRKKKLKLKLRKQQLSNSGSPNVNENKTSYNGEISQQTKKLRRRRRRKSGGENNESSESKLGKLVKVHEKQEKAEKAKEKRNVKLPSAEFGSSLSQVNVGDHDSIEYKSKLKKIEKKKKKKAAALEKKKQLQKVHMSSNEVVLSKNQKKKMRKIARKEAARKKLQETNDQGTSNSSYDLSFSESVPFQGINANDQSSLSIKKRRKKKKNKISDSVDGNVASAQKKFQLAANSTSSKKAVLPDTVELGNKLEKSKKKKMVIAKLLQQSEIEEKTTLQDLKKKRRLKKEESIGGITFSKKLKQSASLRERMAEQLKSARFRWLNEQLYSTNSWEASKFFKEDPDAFQAYHSGYRNQVAQWPMNPLDIIIKSISSLPGGTVVADFGCGEARLAESLPDLKVHSLDLVALQPGVVACDMAHTPLLMESVDVAVFCLSLMGKNLNDFVLEANRVLKVGGLLLIAEVESRFDDVDNFTSAMVHFGFQLKKKDLNNQMFIFMDFKKVRKVSKTGKLPSLSLDPCVYKKR